MEQKQRYSWADEILHTYMYDPMYAWKYINWTEEKNARGRSHTKKEKRKKKDTVPHASHHCIWCVHVCLNCVSLWSKSAVRIHTCMHINAILKPIYSLFYWAFGYIESLRGGQWEQYCMCSKPNTFALLVALAFVIVHTALCYIHICTS